jgi:hypothetical protein
MKHFTRLAAALFSAWAFSAQAAEPNETFETATVLAPGVLTVEDQFAAPGEPNTLLGIRQFGQIGFVDDDNSLLGNGFASGAFVVPTNSGSIDFAVTGFGDDGFDGSHIESGAYEVFVDVYDFFDDLVDQFSEVRTLEPGIAHDFSYNDFEWIGGTYDVYIDNVISGDVDFFRFTGLTPGAPFTAETFAPTVAVIDTLLGWFDSTGALVAANDDIAVGNLLSIVEGNVPDDGQLTFAVSGYGDDDFIGGHGQGGPYELRLMTMISGPPGDYNGDSTVDAADYVVWRKNGGPQQEYETWRANFGATASGGAVSNATVPEPPPGVLLLISLMAATRRRGWNRAT